MANNNDHNRAYAVVNVLLVVIVYGSSVTKRVGGVLTPFLYGAATK